ISTTPYAHARPHPRPPSGPFPPGPANGRARHRLPYVHVAVVAVDAGFGHLVRLPIVDSRRAASSTGRAVGCVWTLPASRCYPAGDRKGVVSEKSVSVS